MTLFDEIPVEIFASVLLEWIETTEELRYLDTALANRTLRLKYLHSLTLIFQSSLQCNVSLTLDKLTIYPKLLLWLQNRKLRIQNFKLLSIEDCDDDAFLDSELLTDVRKLTIGDGDCERDLDLFGLHEALLVLSNLQELCFKNSSIRIKMPTALEDQQQQLLQRPHCQTLFHTVRTLSLISIPMVYISAATDFISSKNAAFMFFTWIGGNFGNLSEITLTLTNGATIYALFFLLYSIPTIRKVTYKVDANDYSMIRPLRDNFESWYHDEYQHHHRISSSSDRNNSNMNHKVEELHLLVDHVNNNHQDIWTVRRAEENDDENNVVTAPFLTLLTHCSQLRKLSLPLYEPILPSVAIAQLTKWITGYGQHLVECHFSRMHCIEDVLIAMSQTCSQLESLTINQCKSHLTLTAYQAIGNSVFRTKLTELKLIECMFPDSACEYLTQSEETRLSHLNIFELSNCKGYSACKLFQFLSACTALRKCKMHYISSSDEVAIHTLQSLAEGAWNSGRLSLLRELSCTIADATSKKKIQPKELMRLKNVTEEEILGKWIFPYPKLERLTFDNIIPSSLIIHTILLQRMFIQCPELVELQYTHNKTREHYSGEALWNLKKHILTPNALHCIA